MKFNENEEDEIIKKEKNGVGGLNDFSIPASLRAAVIFDDENISTRFTYIQSKSGKVLLLSFLLSLVAAIGLSALYYFITEPLLGKQAVSGVVAFALTFLLSSFFLLNINLQNYFVQPYYDQLHKEYPAYCYHPQFIFDLAKKIKKLNRTVQSVIEEKDLETILKKEPNKVKGWYKQFNDNFKDIPTRIMEKMLERAKFLSRTKIRFQTTLLCGITILILMGTLIFLIIFQNGDSNHSITDDNNGDNKDNYDNMDDDENDDNDDDENDDNDDGFTINPFILIPVFNLIVLVLHMMIFVIFIVVHNKRYSYTSLLKWMDRFRTKKITEEELFNRVSSFENTESFKKLTMNGNYCCNNKGNGKCEKEGAVIRF